MNHSVEVAQEEFEKFYLNVDSLLEEKLSESDTRSKIIDYLLLKVLGWNEGDIKREGKTDTGYFDYKIKTPSTHFVVEAKKSFNTFVFPKNHKRVSISALKKGNGDVISQIRGYLVGESLMYGVVCNGKQFIIGKFVNVDGSDWEKNMCKIYDGIEDIKERFVEFYNDLSKNAVIEAGIDFAWNEEIEGRTILSTLIDKDKELIRNDLSAGLRPIIESVFGEIYKAEASDDKEFIESCFVKNSEIRKNVSEIESLFTDSIPSVAGAISIVATDALADSITAEITSYPVSNEGVYEPPKPIVIVGAKGAGKTTFINYLFRSSMGEDIRRNWPLVYLDFRKYDNGMGDRDIIYDDILSKLDESYPYLELYDERILKAIYQKEIARNDKGLWKNYKKNNLERYEEKISDFFAESLQDAEAHLVKISEYLIQSRKMRLCIVIDNADQFDINIQGEVYLFAQSLNRRVKCAVIVALREGYYYKWRHMPPFDAFANNVYHITAPSYKEVLQRRIDFALGKVNLNKLAQGEFQDKRISVSVDKVKSFLSSLSSTLFHVKNSEMLKYLEQTTYPNIRMGLEAFKNFLVSGHTKVSAYILTESYKIPVWEFVKAVALDNKMYYNHEQSVVNNIFYPVSGSQFIFIKIVLLRYLSDRANAEFGVDKYVLIENLVEEFESKGYSKKILLKELSQLLAYRLIDTDESTSDTDFSFGLDDKLKYKLSTAQRICISMCGNYYLNELLNRFHYIELVLQDTPVYDEHLFAEIRKVFPKSDTNGSRDLLMRKQVAETFLDYLKQQESKEITSTAKGKTPIVSEILTNGLAQDLRGLEIVLARNS
jgi:GTPase SAR1 family protein